MKGSLYRRLINLGTSKLEDPEQINDLVFINISCLAGSLVCTIAFIFSLFTDNFGFQILNCISIVACLFPLFFNHKRIYVVAVVFVAFVIPSILVSYTFFFGNLGTEYYLFGGMMVGIYLFRRIRYGFWISIIINGLGILLSKYIIVQTGIVELSGISHLMYFPNITMAIALMGVVTHVLNDYHFRQTNKLEQSKESQSKLISVLSHDLRSPLNNLQILVDELGVENFDKERMVVIRSMITDSLKSTALLLDNTIHWVNKDLHGFSVQWEFIRLKDVVDQNIHLFSHIAGRKSLRVVNKLEDDFIVKGDPDIVDMILRNLISNAIKFTNDGGENVEVNGRVEGGLIWIGVSDRGVGLEPHEIDVLTENKRQSSHGTSDESGMGMGLVLIRYFVELMNSQLSVESHKDSGTTISFSLQLENVQKKKREVTHA